MENLEGVSQQLRSHMKLDRDKGIVAAQAALAEDESKAKPVLEAVTVELLTDGEDVPWESLHGGLLLAMTITPSEATKQFCAERATQLLGHNESRVRMEAGLLLGALCAAFGPEEIYKKYAEPSILDSIRNNLQRDPSLETPELRKQLGKEVNDQKAVFHESAGWKTLETGIKALLDVAKASGAKFSPYISSEVVDLLFSTIKHTNRFVRETAFYVCAEFTTVLSQDRTATKDGIGADAFADRLVKELAVGLSDNWSQVRMAASVATRRFFLELQTSDREKYYGLLLPRMCLNRYYVAEGVRLFSQQTWKLIAGEEGKDLIDRHMKATVDYYISQSQADNHAVREAACSCIAELGLKVRGANLQKHVGELLDALLVCFQDDSWPVRDAACIASGRFLTCFPEEARPHLEQLYDLFFHHVADNIWSVREHAAEALGFIVPAYGDEAADRVMAQIKTLLPAAKDQPELSTLNENLENVTSFGVARPVSPGFSDGGPQRITFSFENKDELHTNQQLYSCGSLAPKLKRGGHGAGCTGGGPRRAVQPWEKTDGCLYLLRELAPIRKEEVCALMPELASVLGVRHFKHHFNLLETAWKQLPIIAAAVGKRNFKRHIELFFDSLHYSLASTHQLCRAAAEDCVQAFAKLFGPKILHGRVENYRPQYCELFDRAAAAGTTATAPSHLAGGRAPWASANASVVNPDANITGPSAFLAKSSLPSRATTEGTKVVPS